ncbi:MAG TPA: alginate lyase family protein [Bacteroidetes bacterium]|nr:alginate lyase family protein [Bacteroidota bacterium]
MLSSYIRLFNTVKYLKPKQINYRLYYFSRKRFRRLLGKSYIFSKSANAQILKLQKSIHVVDCYSGNKKFSFLNLDKKFENSIAWNFSEYGKLWTYNLTYFDYLSQENQEDNILLMESFIDNIEDIKDGLEPFPISLRGINWIKYLSFQKIKNQKIDNSLYAQYYILLDNLEYHLLGNHLLENAFSLLFGAYHFQDEVLYKKAKEILKEELEEQILDDGAHFELSPMYHQIMLFRVLDCINLLRNNKWKDNSLESFLVNKSELMLGWLEQITYKNGEIPLLNDSTNGIAPSSLQLFEYAKRLDLNLKVLSLSSSGYRKIVKENYECILDIGQIGADYIPGHAHADTFNFELQIKGKPFIVDTGLSTYEISLRRTLERSTSSHNTVEVNGKNQSEIWGGFRVAKRAKVIALVEEPNQIEATHDGYTDDDIYHTRQWSFEAHKIKIQDELNRSANAVSRLHFHPSVRIEEIKKRIHVEGDFFVKSYYYSNEFNKQIKAYMLEINFNRLSNMSIIIE